MNTAANWPDEKGQTGSQWSAKKKYCWSKYDIHFHASRELNLNKCCKMSKSDIPTYQGSSSSHYWHTLSLVQCPDVYPTELYSPKQFRSSSNAALAWWTLPRKTSPRNMLITNVKKEEYILILKFSQLIWRMGVSRAHKSPPHTVLRPISWHHCDIVH